jgi:hypothetical protein
MITQKWLVAISRNTIITKVHNIIEVCHLVIIIPQMISVLKKYIYF